MDITKAKRVIELSKDNRKILLTLWEGDKISSCVTEESPEILAKKQRCESCEGDEEVCNDYINHLKEQGYQATEIELGELEIEESLPAFLKTRGGTPTPDAAAERYFTPPEPEAPQEVS